MELGKSGLSALQAFRAVPMEGVSTGTPSSPITAATQPALGKRQRDESNETTTEAQQEGKKAKKALSNSFSEDAEAVGIRFWAVFSSSSVAVFGGGGGAAFIFSKIFDLDRSFYDLILDELRRRRRDQVNHP